MRDAILVAVVVLAGYFWVKRLAGLFYDNKKYTQALEHRYSYDEVLQNSENKPIEEEKSKESEESSF